MAANTIATRMRPKSQRRSRPTALSPRPSSRASRVTAECEVSGASSCGLRSVTSATTAGARPQPSSGAPPGGRDSALLAMANPRIHNSVRNINEQVDEHVGKRREQHDPLDHRIILGEDAGHGELPDAGPEEDRLDDDRPREDGPRPQSPDPQHR